MADPYIPIWMRGTPLEQVYIDAWVETGDAALAREAVRADSRYSMFFAGNLRDDGSVLYDEDTYLSLIESFENTLLTYDLNPDLFSSQFGGLVAGKVSPDEFKGRVANVHERVFDAIPQVRERLTAYYGYGFSDQAILASFLDPTIEQGILDKQISLAEIGAEASRRNFNVVRDFANMLYEAGTDTASEAAQFFSLAESALPVLQTLAARHDDPDDDFSLEEFAQAQVFANPAQRQRLRLLLNQEQSTFAQAPEATVARAQGGARAGGLTGLAEA